MPLETVATLMNPTHRDDFTPRAYTDSLLRRIHDLEQRLYIIEAGHQNRMSAVERENVALRKGVEVLFKHLLNVNFDYAIRTYDFGHGFSYEVEPPPHAPGRDTATDGYSPLRPNDDDVYPYRPTTTSPWHSSSVRRSDDSVQ